jgi:hypothetical protein
LERQPAGSSGRDSESGDSQQVVSKKGEGMLFRSFLSHGLLERREGWIASDTKKWVEGGGGVGLARSRHPPLAHLRPLGGCRLTHGVQSTSPPHALQVTATAAGGHRFFRRQQRHHMSCYMPCPPRAGAFAISLVGCPQVDHFSCSRSSAGRPVVYYTSYHWLVGAGRRGAACRRSDPHSPVSWFAGTPTTGVRG